MTGSTHVDVLVVGAGIVGLAHALHARERGASVAVVERDERAVGASIRNFGHGCITAQSGPALQFALAGRGDWLRLAKLAGFWASDAGTVLLARADDEMAVLNDFAAERGDDVVLLDGAGVRTRAPVACELRGGAFFPLDVRLDPRAAVPAIAAWLARQGVEFQWSTAMLFVDGDEIRTTRGTIRADRVVIAVGHDVDYLYPDIAAAHEMSRCSLHMTEFDNPTGVTIEPAILTGYSLLRYDGFAVSPALAAVRARLEREDPAGAEAAVNLMFTQRPDGNIVLGDTHAYARTVSPFHDEANHDLLLGYARDLFGHSDLHLRRRWQGVYASAPTPFLIASPQPHVRVVSVTSGIGMTTGFGLAQHVIEELLA